MPNLSIFVFAALGHVKRTARERLFVAPPRAGCQQSSEQRIRPLRGGSPAVAGSPPRQDPDVSLRGLLLAPFPVPAD